MLRNHYSRNKKYYKDKAKKRRMGIREAHFKYIGSYLQSNPCVDCGEKDVLVLEFDHKDRHYKNFNVSYLIMKCESHKILAEEVEKCDVRCANCHRRKTQIESKSWRLQYAPVV
jgi:hypothetical protein